MTAAKTAGSTMPQPRSSIQPECLHLRQPLASAEDARDLDVGGGFGEGEEAGEEAGFDVGAEEGLHGVVERAL